MGAGNQQERLSDENGKPWFIAGVIEGEGSMCISIKRHPTTACGFLVDPEFFVYRHRNRRTRDGLVRIVQLAYSMNHDGKQRRRPLQDVIDRILRGHTPDTPLAT